MSKQMICSNCGYQGVPKKVTKGSIIIELALWIMLIVPGIIYSLWRMTSKYKACPKCLSETMIPMDSPMAQKLVNCKQ